MSMCVRDEAHKDDYVHPWQGTFLHLQQCKPRCVHSIKHGAARWKPGASADLLSGLTRSDTTACHQGCQQHAMADAHLQARAGVRACARRMSSEVHSLAQVHSLSL
eukprot:1137079-Pelagomonas_calceolata.AAC.3